MEGLANGYAVAFSPVSASLSPAQCRRLSILLPNWLYLSPSLTVGRDVPT